MESQSKLHTFDLTMRWGNSPICWKSIGIPIKTQHCWSNHVLREPSKVLKKPLEFKQKHSICDITMCWEKRWRCWKPLDFQTKLHTVDLTMCWRNDRKCWKTVGIPIKTEHFWSNYVLREPSTVLKNHWNSNQKTAFVI